MPQLIVRDDGCCCVLWSRGGVGKTGGQDSVLGILLLAMYLTCDSFTSQWQDKVYQKYQVGGADAREGGGRAEDMQHGEGRRASGRRPCSLRSAGCSRPAFELHACPCCCWCCR